MRRMLTEREAALVRDNAASGTADRRGLYSRGSPGILILERPSVIRSLDRQRAKLPPLIFVSRRPRCRVCNVLIEPGEKLLRFQEYIEIEESLHSRQHSGFIHAEACQ